MTAPAPLTDPNASAAAGDIAALQEAFASGTLTPDRLASLCFARGGDAAQAFIRLLPERAHREVLASAARHRAHRPLGPLDGIPISYKDVLDCAGEPTTAGSALYRNAPAAAADAAVVGALTRAGAVTIGKTNLTEFAFSVLGINPHFGTPDNPLHPGQVPGGSSSGAAVAVARGACAIAVGTDTSGSIRVPAAFCGLVGFKPSPGRYPMEGVFPLAPSLDTVGFLARHAADIAQVDAVLVPDAQRASPSIADTTFIIPEGILTSDLDAPVAAAFASAMARLASSGARVERRPVPAIEAAQATLARYGAMVGFEAVKVHAELLRDPASLARIDANVRQRLELAATLPDAAYIALCEARARLAAELAADIGAAVLLCPTVPHLAPERAPLVADPARFAAINLRTLRNTMLGSYLRMPGLALPIGDSASPASLLASCAEGGDGHLLHLGPQLEQLLSPPAAPSLWAIPG